MDEYCTGGFLGRLYNGSIFQCYAEGRVEALVSGGFDGVYVGGFVGAAVSGTISQSRMSGSVYVLYDSNGSSSISVGGLIGASEAVVSNCYTSSSVLVDSPRNSRVAIFAGGLIGDVREDVDHCYTKGSVEVRCGDSSGFSAILAGGIAGNLDNCQVLNTVALGSYVIIRGNNGIASVHRILGGLSNNLNNNYAFSTMALGKAATYGGVADEDIVTDGLITDENGGDQSDETTSSVSFDPGIWRGMRLKWE